jgi:hypothetical protein
VMSWKSGLACKVTNCASETIHTSMVLLLQLSKEGKSFGHMSSHKFHAPRTGTFAMNLEFCSECGTDHFHGTLHNIIVGDHSSMSVLVFISDTGLFSLTHVNS